MGVLDRILERERADSYDSEAEAEDLNLRRESRKQRLRREIQEGKRLPAPRDARGRILPGNSLNPLGPPKRAGTMVDRARAAVDAHCVDAWIEEVAEGGRDWMRCSELLAAYGYGKPKETVKIEREIEAPKHDLDALTWEEKIQLEALLSKAEKTTKAEKTINAIPVTVTGVTLEVTDGEIVNANVDAPSDSK